MAQKQREAGEGGGVSDGVTTTVTTGAGIAIKGPDPDEWAFRDEQLLVENENKYRSLNSTDLRQIAATRNLDVGSKANKDQIVRLLVADDLQKPPDDGLPVGYAEGQLKGPGAQWERDEDGQYANR